MIKKVLFSFILVLILHPLYSFSFNISNLGIEVKLVQVVQGTYGPYKNLNPYDIIISVAGEEFEEPYWQIQREMEKDEDYIKFTVLRASNDEESVNVKKFLLKDANKKIKFADREEDFHLNRNPDRKMLGFIAKNMLMVTKKNKDSHFPLEIGDLFYVNYQNVDTLSQLVSPLLNTIQGEKINLYAIKKDGLELLSKGLPEGKEYIIAELFFAVPD